jgi:hypothetical protein
MAHADPEDGEEVTTVGVEDCVAVLKGLLEHADLLRCGGSSSPMQVLYPSPLPDAQLVLLPLVAMHVFGEMLQRTEDGEQWAVRLHVARCKVLVPLAHANQTQPLHSLAHLGHG